MQLLGFDLPLFEFDPLAFKFLQTRLVLLRKKVSALSMLFQYPVVLNLKLGLYQYIEKRINDTIVEEVRLRTGNFRNRSHVLSLVNVTENLKYQTRKTDQIIMIKINRFVGLSISLAAAR
jgi:hypothetical protein